MAKNKTFNPVVVLVSIFLAWVFFFLGFGAADPGKTWVPLGTAEKRAGDGNGDVDKEPALTVIHSTENHLNIKLTNNGFFVSERIENSLSYKVLHMGKYNGESKPGYPNLPTIRQYIYIPDGKTARVQVNPGRAVTFDNFRVYPVQPPRLAGKDGGGAGFYADDSVYNADRVFPSDMAYIGETERIRGRNIAMLHVCPFRYNPGQKVLNVYPDIDVQVTFDGEKMPVMSRVRSSDFDSLVKGFVLNPGAMGGQEISGCMDSNDGAEFLIITAPEFLAAANALRSHKENLGMTTLVKTTGDTGITVESIKDYIQHAYDAWATVPSYILLLGDVEYIPTWYRTMDPDSFRGLMGTDLYYSCVDGDDYQPDIFLGRIPVDTLAEADAVVQKIIDYESNPPNLAAYYTNAAVVATFTHDYYNDGHEELRNVRTSEEIRDFLLTRGRSVERIYGLNSWTHPTHFNNDYYGNGEPLPPELLMSNGFSWEGDAADIIASIDSGIFLLVHRGISSSQSWSDPDFSIDDFIGLNNRGLYPVVFSNGSHTGHFDVETDYDSYSNYESFCELLLQKSNSGAVAVIGASRATYAGYGDFMDEGFIDSVWPDFLPSVPNSNGASSRLGPMLNHGKIAMDIMWGDPQGLRRVEYEIVHLFGDPTLQMWTQQPGSPGTQTVSIQSDPWLGVPITVNQTDVNGKGDGFTNFTRTYPQGTSITLTAPSAFSGCALVKWVVDGTVVRDPVIQLTMDQYHQAAVYYTAEKTLYVKSFPVNGIPITVTPSDNSGNGNGNTNFNRYYTTGTEVTLTAPEGFNGRFFTRWTVDGTPVKNRTIRVTMDGNHTVFAEFSVMSNDKKILIIDPSLTENAQKAKNAVEANGFDTEYTILMPTEISNTKYPAVFFFGEESEASQWIRFAKYLDNGGNLYMEDISRNNFDPSFFKPYFGIVDTWWGWYTPRITGIPGTFTEGFDFTFPAYTVEVTEFQLADDVPGVFVIWDSYEYTTPDHVGVALDAKTFKTIGVGFEFKNLPQAQQTAVMGKYLDFFFPVSKRSTLNVTSPNGGENLIPGSVHQVTWNSSNVVGLLKISLWKDGLPVGIIADGIDHTRSSYRWIVGNYNGGAAAPGTGYLIKIEEIGGVSDLSDAPFTISSASSLRVISPNGGENLTRGTTQPITWKTTNVSGTLKITLWKDGALTGVIADGINPSPGSYLWTVGNYSGGTASAGTGYKVKIEENGTTVSDTGDTAFTILSSPSITVTSPNGGENLALGTIYPIAWDFSNVNGALKITLWKDGALVGIIVDKIDPSRKSYGWEVGTYNGGTADAGAGYNVMVEENGTGASDSGDNTFTISGPHALTVMSPNGGETYTLGTTRNITWKSSNVSGTLKITLLKDGAALGVIADHIDPSVTSFQWTVGNYTGGTASPGTGYKVKIEENGTASSDTGDNPFTILDPSSITVTAPNGGESLTIGQTYPITWSASKLKGGLKITLWKDGAELGVITPSVDPARGSYSWTVGNYKGGTAAAGEGYKVKIEEDGTGGSDISDASFTLLDPPSITVTSPNGGEDIKNGTPFLITWKAVNIGGTLKITLWSGDYLYSTIADNINPGLTSYQWTPSYYSGVEFKVKIEENGSTISDMSDNFFKISDSSSITSIYLSYTPVSNNFFIGQTCEIRWNTYNITRTMKITLWKDGALVGTIADYLEPKVEYYQWKMGTYTGGVAVPGTGYKVKIEEHDTGVSGMSAAPFTILPIPSITVTSPSGGEVLTRGTTFNITWRASNVPWKLRISLVKDGSSPGDIATDIDPGVTTYQWTVGNLKWGVAQEGSGYQVMVSVMDTSYSGVSENSFAIYWPPSAAVTDPNGGEQWGLNDVENITWDAVKLTGTLKLTLWKDSSMIGVIADGINPNPETYAWTVGSYVGGVASPGVGYQVKIEENGSSISDMSDASFEITPAHIIRVISPNGGETITKGTTRAISWTSTNVTGYLEIYLYREGSSSYIAYVSPSTTSYQWFVDEEVGEGYQIRIEESGTAYYDMSDSWFTISGVYSLRVTSPNGGEQWALNSVKQITWTHSNITGPGEIYLVKADGYDEKIADIADITTGSYNWTVGSLYYGGTAPVGSGYKVRIETDQTPYIYDMSNNTFTITGD